MPIALSVVVIAEAFIATSVSLDFFNIVLMWLILAFVGGAMVGFFTEDKRPGRHHRFWDPISAYAGGLGGLATVFFLYRSLQLRWPYLVMELVSLAFPLILLLRELRFGKLEKEGKINEGQNILWRAFSNYRHQWLKGVAVFGWFGIVRIPDHIRVLLLPDRAFEVTLDETIIISLLGIGIALCTKILGALCDIYQKAILWRTFERVAHEHYRKLLLFKGPDEQSYELTRGNALLMAFLIKMGMGHWADAKSALDAHQRGSQHPGLTQDQIPAGTPVPATQAAAATMR